MSLLISTFEGLTEEDFDNFLPPRWSSNLHNLGRMKTKARVLTLAKALADRIGRDGLVVEASSEIPSVWNNREVRDQWAYLLRDADARRTLAPVVAGNLDLATRVKDPAEHHRHALMCVRLDHQGLEVGLRINQHATVDLANLLGRAEAQLGALDAALAALPDDVTLDGEPVTAARLKDAARAARAGEADWVVVARSLPRDAAIARGEAIREQVEAVADALEPLFRFVLWTPENDHIGVGSQIEAFAEAVEARERAEEDRKAAADAARAARESEARARTSAKVAAEEAWRKLQAEKRRKIAEARAAEEKAAAAKAAAERAAAEERAAAAKAAEPEAAEQAPTAPEASPPEASPPEATAPEATAPARPARGPRDDDRGRGRRDGGRPSGARRTSGARKGPPGRGKPGPRRDAGPAKAQPKAAEKPAPKPPAPKPAKAHTFAPGDACRLTRGLFAGKQGQITGQGKAGYYKVKVGPLEVSVSAAEIEPVE